MLSKHHYFVTLYLTLSPLYVLSFSHLRASHSIFLYICPFILSSMYIFFLYLFVYVSFSNSVCVFFFPTHHLSCQETICQVPLEPNVVRETFSQRPTQTQRPTSKVSELFRRPDRRKNFGNFGEQKKAKKQEKCFYKLISSHRIFKAAIFFALLLLPQPAWACLRGLFGVLLQQQIELKRGWTRALDLRLIFKLQRQTGRHGLVDRALCSRDKGFGF